MKHHLGSDRILPPARLEPATPISMGILPHFYSIYPECYHISLVISQTFFFFQNNPKDLDPSYKMDLDLCDCL